MFIILTIIIIEDIRRCRYTLFGQKLRQLGNLCYQGKLQPIDAVHMIDDFISSSKNSITFPLLIGSKYIDYLYARDRQGVIERCDEDILKGSFPEEYEVKIPKIPFVN